MICYKHDFWIVLRYEILFSPVQLMNRKLSWDPKLICASDFSIYIILRWFGSIIWEYAILIADTYVEFEKSKGIYMHREAAIFQMFICSNRLETMLDNVPC